MEDARLVIFATILLSMMASISAFSIQDFFMGCPTRDARDPLNPSTSYKIAGTWYKYQIAQPSFIAAWYQNSRISFEQVQKSSDTFNFEDRLVLPWVQSRYSYKGKASILNFRKAKLKCSGTFLGFSLDTTNQILATDYDNYAILSMCKDFGYFHIGAVFVLTRTPSVTSENVLLAIKDAMNNLGLDKDSFTPIYQDSF